MAHPFASHREVNPGRKAAVSRVKAYASGGKAKHSDEKQDRALFSKMLKEKGEYNVGGAVSAPSFARGGRSKGGKGKGKNKGTHINIAVVAPHGKPDEAATMPPPGLPPGPPPGGPPMAPPPGMGPGPAPGGPPPGMPPMKRGGVAYAKGGKVPMKGGAESGVGRLDKVKAYNARKG